MARTKITNSDKEVMIRFGRILDQKMQSARLGFTDVSRLTGDKVKVSYISDVVRAGRGNSQKFFRMGRDKVAQIAAALNWDEGEALRLAGLHPDTRPAETIEEVLDAARYFDQKGLSETDRTTLRPLLEVADREAERLLAQHPQKEAPKTRTPTTITRSSGRQRDAIDEAIRTAASALGGDLSEKNQEMIREVLEKIMNDREE